MLSSYGLYVLCLHLLHTCFRLSIIFDKISMVFLLSPSHISIGRNTSRQNKQIIFLPFFVTWYVPQELRFVLQKICSVSGSLSSKVRLSQLKRKDADCYRKGEILKNSCRPLCCASSQNNSVLTSRPGVSRLHNKSPWWRGRQLVLWCTRSAVRCLAERSSTCWWLQSSWNWFVTDKLKG